MSYDAWKLRSPDDEYDAIAVADMHESDWFDQSYYDDLKAEIAQCERRLTCLILSQNDREMEQEFLKDLYRYIAREDSKPRMPL
jgi:hypothetical protein